MSNYNPDARPIIDDWLADRDTETAALRDQVRLLIERLESELDAANKRIIDINRKLAEALSMEVANNRNLDYAVGLIKELHEAWIDPTITVYVADESSETLRWRVERFLGVALPV